MQLTIATIVLGYVSPILATPFLAERAAKCVPVDLRFQYNVPHDAQSTGPSNVNYGGFNWKLPTQGNLVSFYGNYRNSSTTSSQITTVSQSNSTEGGTSTSTGSGMANGTTVISTTFSSGNASSAAVAAQQNTSGTSSSSSGLANSTATANAAGQVNIFTDANVADASNSQSVQNERQAAAATSCTADNDGASATAEQITSVTFTTAEGTKIDSVAYAACSAGVNAPSAGSGSSSSGSQASVSAVTATVMCDGTTTTVSDQQTQYIVVAKGVYCSNSGFSGALTGQRAAKSVAQC
ncbi:hypothetical protein E4T44_03267 [Aureobasidium sp. EXF-8845]|nr:hypothetical protein E4T44_03267 [Aureobasidium sp. EXF-8845]KAI4855310.1 hypothetical protein E4T45_03250 [Aureobasidium sp. EXF-8846]